MHKTLRLFFHYPVNNSSFWRLILFDIHLEGALGWVRARRKSESTEERWNEESRGGEYKAISTLAEKSGALWWFREGIKDFSDTSASGSKWQEVKLTSWQFNKIAIRKRCWKSTNIHWMSRRFNRCLRKNVNVFEW